MILLFWCQLTQVVLQKRPLNECISSSSSVVSHQVDETSSGKVLFAGGWCRSGHVVEDSPGAEREVSSGPESAAARSASCTVHPAPASTSAPPSACTDTWHLPVEPSVGTATRRAVPATRARGTVLELDRSKKYWSGPVQ